MGRRSTAVALVVVALAALAATGPAAAQTSEPAVVTTVSDVANHRFPDGSPGALGYKVTHEFNRAVGPGRLLPSARVDAAQHPEAFDGVWADQGLHAAWLAPKGFQQFYPDAYTVESGYFENFTTFDGTTMQPGDHAEIAVKQLAGDSPLTWDAQRGEATGQPGWEVARHTQTIEATYGGVTESVDVIFVRADLVVRGGDLDARDGSFDLPPLVVDLGKSYGPDARASTASASFAPYLHYIRNLEGLVVPQAGTAVFTAATRGYLPEAAEHIMPGGARINEWHVPMDFIITVREGETPLSSRALTTLPAAGRVWSIDERGTSRVDVPPGASVLTGDGIAPRVVTPPGLDVDRASAQPSSASAERAGSGGLLGDVRTLAPIDSTLQEPVDVVVAKRGFGFTIDPDLYGSGVLGIRSFRDGPSGSRYLETVAVPSVSVDGTTIPLDSSRLVDLRAVPLADYIRIRFTARGDGLPVDAHSSGMAREGRVTQPGVVVESVYTLGNGRYAMATLFATREGDSLEGSVTSHLRVWSLLNEPASVNAIHYLEPADPGPLLYDGRSLTTEFAGPMRGIQTSTTGVIGGATGGADVTIVRSTSTPGEVPEADPTASIEGAPVALYMSSRTGSASGFYESFMAAGLATTPEPRLFELPDAGESCRDPQVVDDVAADATTGLDIERAWFDFDGRRLYGTLQVADLGPAAIAQQASYRISFRHEHLGWGMQATRDATGKWAFEFGLHSSAGAAWNPVDDAQGEVVPGSPGFIRMSVPVAAKFSDGFFQGELLRDTGAVSSDANGVIDRVPAGSPDFGYGRGGDFLVQGCTPQVAATRLSFPLGAPTAGQYSDEVTVQATLTDESGAPVAGRTVRFVLSGGEVLGTTDESGLAMATIRLRSEPGSYILDAHFDGAEDLEASTASAGFEILREDTSSTLTVQGSGSRRSLTARVEDADDAGPVTGRTVDFYADGTLIGSAVTGQDGIATLTVPARYRGGRHVFGSSFAGDAFYLGSSATAS